MNPKTVSPQSAIVPKNPFGRETLAKFFRALGDANRIALIGFIAEQERSGNDCVTFLKLAQSRVSSHLSCLVSFGLLTVRRDGRFAYYSITDQRVLELVGMGSTIASDNAESVAKWIKSSST